MKKIIISGSPGTGKTTVSERISDSLGNSEVLSLNDIVLKKQYTIHYDKSRDTHVADFERLIPYITKKIQQFQKKNLEIVIIEGHFADIIPNKFIDCVIILRCHPDTLKERLTGRSYSKNKIYENIQAEILGNCTNYFIEKNLDKPIYEFDTSDKSAEESMQIIVKMIKGKINKDKYKVGKINWMEDLSNEDRLMEFFE